MKTTLFSALALFFSISANAQIASEFLVYVDRYDGTWDIIDSIPPIRWVDGRYTYSTELDLYTCCCGDDFGDKFLYSMHRSDASIVHSPLMAPEEYGKYHNTYAYYEGEMYVFRSHGEGGDGAFGKLDIETGDFTPLLEIEGPRWGPYIDGSMVDKANGKFIFHSQLTGGGPESSSLFVVDIDDLVLEAVTPLPEIWDEEGLFWNWFDFQFDSSTGTLYGLHHNSEGAHLATIDYLTGEYQIISSFPEIDQFWDDLVTVLDEYNQQIVTFSSADKNDWEEDRLLTIDLTTGELINSVAFPVGLDYGENVVMFGIDQDDGAIISLHWDFDYVGVEETTESDMRVLNRSRHGFIEVQFNQAKQRTLVMHDAAGTLLHRTGFNSHLEKVSTKGLSSGVYVITVQEEAQTYSTRVFLE